MKVPAMISAALACTCSVVQGATIVVPDDFLTIQGAIDFAAPADSILVRPGTYIETIVIDKSLSLIGTSGPQATVIDGRAATRPDSLSVVLGLAPENLVLEGFTIRRGAGGSSLPDLPAGSGSGVFMYGGGGSMRNCIVTENFCNGYGGGIYLAACNMSLTDCVISNNEALDTGGGIAGLFSAPVIERCTIEGNHAGTNGAIWLEVGSPEVRDCVIRNNRTDVGFAVHAGSTDSPGNLLRTLMTGNTGDTPSRIGVVSHAGTIDHCTIAGNEVRIAVGMGPGTILNTIIANNEGAEAIRCSSAPEIRCSDVFGNTVSDDLCGTDMGGNIHLDPIFCEDLSIATTSPCAPEHAPSGCGLIGAYGVSCTVAVEEATWGRIKAAAPGRWR